MLYFYMVIKMIVRDKTCCFTGHRYIANSQIPQIEENLKEKIALLYKEGVSVYLCGGALGFDTIAAEAVIQAKKSMPDIKLIMTLPCPEQDKKWNKSSQERYKEILNQADDVIYISESYHRDCMLKRNRFMVDNSSHCLFYLTNEHSGTGYTIKYAIKNNLKIINLIY